MEIGHRNPLKTEPKINKKGTQNRNEILKGPEPRFEFQNTSPGRSREG